MPKISDVGEDSLISMFAPRLPKTHSALVGPGDDAAVLALDGDLVVSSDVLVEDRHFRSEWSTAEDVGYRAAMQNLADIDAMGAVPVALQVTLAAPGSTQVDWVMGLADGLREACEPYGVGVTGGDLSEAKSISISVTALGDTKGARTVLRSGARATNVVAVSGPLGASVAGYHQLDNFLEIDIDTINLFLRPQPRIGAGVEAAATARATAMMDISDGLVQDLSRLAKASKMGIEIASELVPIHPGAQRVAGEVMADALEWALTGGEDHHLVATFPERAHLPAGWTVVGRCTSGHEGVLVDGEILARGGWEHFASA